MDFFYGIQKQTNFNSELKSELPVTGTMYVLY